MNRAELRTFVQAEVRRRGLEIPSPLVVHFWLNRAGRDFARDSRTLRSSKSYTTTAGTATVALDGDVMELLVASYLGLRLEYMAPQDIALTYGTDWETQQGSPWAYYMQDAATVRLFPIPDAAAAFAATQVRTWKSTDDMGTDTASPPLPERWHVALAHYAIGHIAPNHESVSEYAALLADARGEAARGFSGDVRHVRSRGF